MLRLWVANTDYSWFKFLSNQPEVDEVNFWQPSGKDSFKAISQGELFLFKLKSPHNVIAGYGVFHQASNLPLSMAWDAFGYKNGVDNLDEMRRRIAAFRNDRTDRFSDYTIGCRIVVQPVFFPEHLWIPQPSSWGKSIVVGKTYLTSESNGLHLWERIQEATEALNRAHISHTKMLSDTKLDFRHEGPKFGEPTLIKPRLGQGAFRLGVIEAYQRQCALSAGRVLPALDAAHIRPYGRGGEHEISNGLLLRKDIHSVFDAGYATFDEDLCFVVSDKVRTVFNNGNEYRKLHGSKLLIPSSLHNQPDQRSFAWHRENVYLG